MNIILIGPPGSGKGTQIKEIKKYLDVEVISTGDITRDLAKQNEEIKKTLSRGELISDEVLLAEIDLKLKNIGKDKAIIFDGFPRSLTQAEKLEHLMLDHGLTVDKAIYIVLDEEEVVKRLSIRKVCEQCGQPIYEGEICSSCGGKATLRPDDSRETVINRMQVFLDKTMPLVSFYKNKSILKEINGKQSVEAVAADIKEAIK
jgi:adenylate kinase